MEDLALAAEKVATLMRLLTTTGQLRLKYRITAGAGAVDPDGFERRDIYVECKGPDSDLLLSSDGELLRSLEHVSAKILRLEPRRPRSRLLRRGTATRPPAPGRCAMQRMRPSRRSRTPANRSGSNL